MKRKLLRALWVTTIAVLVLDVYFWSIIRLLDKLSKS